MVKAVYLFWQGVAMPAMNNILSKWIPVSERSRSLALVYSGMYLGSVTGLAFSPILIHRFGWPSVFYSFGSLGSIWFALWLRKVSWRCFEFVWKITVIWVLPLGIGETLKKTKPYFPPSPQLNLSYAFICAWLCMLFGAVFGFLYPNGLFWIFDWIRASGVGQALCGKCFVLFSLSY